MLRRAGLIAVLPALLVPAVAGTTVAAAKTRAPVVKRITPKHVFVGETLTIRGRHFRRGINKNTVAFKRSGAKAVFVKAEKGTTKLLKVELPKRLEKVLVVKNGTPTPTRLSVRVLAYRFGKRFTSRSRSPIVGPEKPPTPPEPAAVDPNADCDGDRQINRYDADDDNDLLGDTLEKSLKLDQCNVDSDRDGAEDGFEYQSARDLNDDEDQNPNSYLPYPAKKPYPNPLDKTDADVDHDGDSLTLIQEYRLWKYATAHGESRTLERLSYSAGEQFSKSTRVGGGRRTPTLAANGYNKQAQFMAWATGHNYAFVSLANLGTGILDPAQAEWYDPAGRSTFDIRDANRDGLTNPERTYYDDGDTWLNDAERDEDADGLTNFSETRGCMSRGLWDKLYLEEAPYPLAYAGTDLADGDTDGDGVLDGADDQDNDDVPNIMECSRSAAAGRGRDPRDANAVQANLPATGFVNPFNPCLPHYRSRTCLRWIEVSGPPFAPFDATKVTANKYYFIWN
jgi:hypothetical protein